MKYDYKAVEAKWQKVWEDEKTFHAEIDHTKPKFYALVEFPYPSGAGLERQPVGPEAVVVEMREIVQGFRAIRADQAALDQLVELLLVGERRLAELHFSAPTKK